jgi:hypothetical protein
MAADGHSSALEASPLRRENLAQYSVWSPMSPLGTRVPSRERVRGQQGITQSAVKQKETMKLLKTVQTVFCTALPAAAIVSPAARADDWSRNTIIALCGLFALGATFVMRSIVPVKP